MKWNRTVKKSRRHFLKLSLTGTTVLGQSLLFSKLAPVFAQHSQNSNKNNLLGNSIIESVKKLKDNKTLSLTILYPEGSLANIKPIADLFSEHTDIDIKFIKTTVDDINTKILISTARQKTNFDIALPATFGIPDLVEANALTDLTTFAQQYEKQSNYQPSLYSLGDSYKNRKFGYQTDGDAYVMFYKKDIFSNPDEQKRFADTYGYSLALPQTWEQLDTLMKYFHRPDEDQYGGCLFRTPRYMVWEWWVRFHAKGYYPLQDDMTPNINNELAVSALEDLITATQYQHPSVKSNGLFENWKLYAQGQCAVNIGWGGTQKYLNSASSKVRNKLFYAPTPEVSYFNWGWNYVVSNFSAEKEIAYLFCLYATSQGISNQAVHQKYGFFDPFRIEHYEDAAVQQAYGVDFLAAHKQAMQTAIPDFYIEGRGRYIKNLETNILSVTRGDLSVREALDFTEKQWEKITDEIGRSKQIEQWRFLKSQYPKHLELKSA